MNNRPLYLSARDIYKVDDTKDCVVYESIMAAICEWQLLPGSKLPEDGLADYFNVSRTVIRKALQRLAIERMVEIHPNRGAFVKKTQLQEAKDMFQLRRFYELGLIEPIVENVQPKHIDHLINKILAVQLEARKTSNTSKMLIMSMEFSLYLSTVLGNPIITSLLASMLTRIILALAVFGRNYPAALNVDYQANLIECLKQKDKLLAKELLIKHLDLHDDTLKIDNEKEETNFDRVFGQLQSISTPNT